MNLHGVLKYWVREYAEIADAEEMYHEKEIDDEIFIDNMKRFVDRSFVALCDTLQLVSDMEDQIVDLQDELDYLEEMYEELADEKIVTDE